MAKPSFRDCTHDAIVYIDPETGEERWVSSGLDALGRECPDPTPLAPPVALGSHMTLADTVQHMLRSAKLRELAAQEGFDSEDEANDFEIEDEPLAPGMTLFEAWADLASRGLVPEGPPQADGPHPETVPSSSSSKPGKAAGEEGGHQAPPPTSPPAVEPSAGS